MATWIFLRGLTRQTQHWGDFGGHFERALPGQRWLALDLPGNGLLNRQVSPCRVADMVQHCREQLVEQCIEPPYHVLAMSLGAMVALAWSQAHPQELAAQALINTSVRSFSPFYQRLRPANYAILVQLALLGATPAQWERAVLRMTSRQQDESVLAHWLALRHAHPVSRRNALRQLLAAARFHAPSSAPGTPTLLLASEQDQLVSVQCSRAIAQRWQCDLRIHANAGHDLALDDGAWVARQVRDWISALTAHPPGIPDEACGQGCDSK